MVRAPGWDVHEVGASVFESRTCAVLAGGIRSAVRMISAAHMMMRNDTLKTLCCVLLAALCAACERPAKQPDASNPDFVVDPTTGALVRRSYRGGGVEPKQIQEVVRAAFPAFRACYEAGLRRNAALSGKLVVRALIRPDGHVGGVSVVRSEPTPTKTGVTTIADADVVSCIVRTLGRLAFPQSKAQVVFTYPVIFSPGSLD